MRRAVLPGLCLAGALFVIGVASAAAAPPEFGRCVKVAVGTGVYATANCTSEGGEKKYEWLPGPPPNPKFTLAYSPKFEAFLIEGAVSRAKIICQIGPETGEGEILSATTVGNIAIAFAGCETAGVPCNFEESEGKHEIRFSGVSGTLGVIKTGETPLKDQIGLTLSGETTFQCGGGGIKVDLRGSAVGVISGKNAMTTKRTWHFRTAKDKQLPEAFEGGLPQTFEAIVNGTPERANIELWDTFTTAEKVEINTVV